MSSLKNYRKDHKPSPKKLAAITTRHYKDHMKNRVILSFLIIFSLVSMGISPACAFISGKSYIEICKADGSVQRIEVDPSQNPAEPEKPPQDHEKIQKDCAFCFTASVGGKIISATTVSISPPPANYIRISQGVYAQHTALRPTDTARAPPHIS